MPPTGSLKGLAKWNCGSLTSTPSAGRPRASVVAVLELGARQEWCYIGRMAISLGDLAKTREPRTEEEWRAAEREYEREREEDRRYKREREAYKEGRSLLTHAGVPRSLRPRMVTQQMDEWRRAERELYWDEPAL